MKNNLIKILGDVTISLGKGTLWRPCKSQKINENLSVIVSKGMVNLYVFKYKDVVICSDAGNYNDSRLQEEFSKLGIDHHDVTHLLLTHVDPDHAGSLDYQDRYHHFPNAKILAGKTELEVLNKRIPRLTSGSIKLYNPLEIHRNIDILGDAQEFNIGSVKVEMFVTTGHSPGHMSFVLNNEILLTGDSMLLDNKMNRLPFYAP
ncbi:MAG: MBL fold metallo-hydrolase [Tunicatimonas sp.]